MSDKISKQGKRELLEVLRQRYQQAAKQDKSKILDEFVAVAGCHRKHAIRLLTANGPLAATAPVVARRTYDEAVRQALIVLWEAADRICGKRLKAVLPGLIAALERHGHLNLDAEVRQRVLAVSAATIDRLLASVRSNTSQRRKRRASTKPSKEIPIRTFADYGDALPGYLEIDFVSHGGTSMQGVFLWSLVATDVCSGWTEAVALVAREQSLVVEGLEVIRRQFPIPIKGIDSDNDSAFINETLQAYCQEQKWEFTRSRAYQKNDQAWIEQKNGAVVRRFVGYERHAGMVAGQCLARLYQSMRLFVNYFQPSMKLRSKIREGAKVKKTYHKPATPCERLLAHASVAEAVKEKLRAEQGAAGPTGVVAPHPERPGCPGVAVHDSSLSETRGMRGRGQWKLPWLVRCSPLFAALLAAAAPISWCRGPVPATPGFRLVDFPVILDLASSGSTWSGLLLSRRRRQQRRPLLPFQVRLHRRVQILPHRSPLLRACRDRRPDPLTPVLPLLPACPLGYVSVDHHEPDGLFGRVVRRRYARRRNEAEITLPELLHPCCQVRRRSRSRHIPGRLSDHLADEPLPADFETPPGAVAHVGGSPRIGCRKASRKRSP